MHCKKSIQFAVLGLGAFILAAGGCATKKYVNQSVQQSVEPLQAGMTKANQEIADNTSRIRGVDRRAETGISNTQNSADHANQTAKQAGQQAQAANQLAQQGLTQANQAQDTANNIDNFKSAQHTTVHFGLDRSTLTAHNKQSLDQLVQAVKPLKHYVIQVQGYTDATGPKAFNLQLSQRRANAVVRYLTLNGEIPLVKIYNLGYGEASPAHSNRTLKGRKANRRVDVTVMVPQIPGQTSQSAQASSMGSEANQ